jgi:hypothetical protein
MALIGVIISSILIRFGLSAMFENEVIGDVFDDKVIARVPD